MTEIQKMKQKAKQLRIDVIDMVYGAGSGHIGGSFSSIEILTVLYDSVLKLDCNHPDWEERDRFVLSKGHAAPALYAVLASKNLISPEKRKTLRKLGSDLQGHPCMFKLPFVEMSTGSLGMGVSVGVGMALSARLLKKAYHVFVLCGDGEMQEGQNWEGFMAMSKWNLKNMTVIIDRNRVQLDGTEQEIMPLGDLGKKLESFDIEVISCDGHDIASLLGAFARAQQSDKPTAIIAQTVKGKGVTFMEGQAAWHGKALDEQTYTVAMSELKEDFKPCLHQ